MTNAMDKKGKAQGPGRPKDMEKRAAILASAKTLFVDRGYTGTSMDAVAASAGVSKLTVYSHFGDKDHLFRQAVRERSQELLPEQLYLPDPGIGLRQALLKIARHHAQLMNSVETIGVWRTITSDCSSRGPRMGRMLWEEGPQRVQTLLTGLFAGQVRAGMLDIPDPSRAATQFMALLKGDLYFRRMLGCVEDDCSDFEIEVKANAEAAVDMFLRAYGTDAVV